MLCIITLEAFAIFIVCFCSFSCTCCSISSEVITLAVHTIRRLFGFESVLLSGIAKALSSSGLSFLTDESGCVLRESNSESSGELVVVLDDSGVIVDAPSAVPKSVSVGVNLYMSNLDLKMEVEKYLCSLL